MSIGKSEREGIENALVETIGLSQDDAALAWDRVHGGIVRASTGNEANCPSKDKDPLAWLSFHKATADNSIIAAVYPKFAEEGASYPIKSSSHQSIANRSTQPGRQSSEGNTMKNRRGTCRALSLSLLLPGIACFAALYVPALHGTDFSAFAARYWWTLLFAGAALSLLGLIVCQFVKRD